MSHIHYFIGKSDPSLMDLKPELIYTGLVCDDPNWFNIEHSHPFCEVCYVAGGEGFITIEGSSFHVKAGDLAIISPQVNHEERSHQENPLTLIFLAIKDFCLPGLRANHLIAPEDCPIIHCNQYKYKMDIYFQELLQESSSQIEFYQSITQNLISTILIMIMRLSCIAAEDLTSLSPECQKIKEYLDQNYISSITLDTLSETVFISKHYLAHIFKEQTGISPIKYLITKRMEHACELLTTTQDSITKISHAVGYDNPLYFSQVFKKMNGVSPAEFRALKT